MNGFEFLFALTAVAGMTTVHFLWLRFAYKMENINKKEKQKPKPDHSKHEIADDIIDYDGMGQGRFMPRNNRMRP